MFFLKVTVPPITASYDGKAIQFKIVADDKVDVAVVEKKSHAESRRRREL